MTPFRRFAATAAGALALAGIATSSAAALPTDAPAGTTLDQLYAPPAAQIPGTPGSIVWTQPIPASDLASLNVPFQDAPPPHLSFRVIYRSISVDGTPNVASAAVYVPLLGAGGTPNRPTGGWKVAAFDHATSGGADLCAPSRVTAQIPGPNGTLIDNPELTHHVTTGNELIGNLLSDNVVTVKVDYEGLGTPGRHPYLIASSLGRATIDAVKATRQLLAASYGAASTQWVVAGQSEGGIAALGTSSLAPTLAPDLQLKGTLAAVPPINNKLLVFDLVGALGISYTTPLAALMVNGAATVSPTLDDHLFSDILSTEGANRWPSIETRCLQQLGATDALGVSFSHVFGPDADDYRDELYRVLDENDPNNIVLGPEPVQFWAGGLDLIAPQSMVFAAARRQRDVHGKNVTWKSNPWAIHPNIVDNDYSGRAMADWLVDQLNR